MLIRFWLVLTFAVLSVGSFAQHTVAIKGAKNKAMYDLIGDVKMVVCSPYNNFGTDTLHFDVDGARIVNSFMGVSVDSLGYSSYGILGGSGSEDYNDGGQLVERFTVSGHCGYSYDDVGRLVRDTFVTRHGDMEELVYHYVNGELSYVICRSGSIDEDDLDNRPTTLVSYIILERDVVGNWTERLCSDGGVETRKIEYW